jgi:hypothetical protein
MRDQVRQKLDEILDRYEKIMIHLSKEEKIEFQQTLLEEIE